MGGIPTPQYDFIVIGAGPAGCSVASFLARSKARPSVLLVEAGGDNSDINLRVDGDKCISMLNPATTRPYASLPQKSLDGREIGLPRGNGLGGSTAINFTAYTVGVRDDWETMARITGDGAWRWDRAQSRWKTLENFHAKAPDVPPGVEKYLNPKSENHGYSGPLHIGFPYKWEYDITAMMDIWEANGYPTNPDASSGELGTFIAPLTTFRGVRVTAADLVFRASDNLHVLTNSPVHRVVFDGKNATGISLIDGRSFNAKKEIIISAGSFDSPKILMHSGIGPADQLSKFNIPILHENPAVGQNYKDHYHIALKYIRADHTSEKPAFFRDKERQKKAMLEWQLYRTGEYTTIGTAMIMGFFKSDAILNSPEFAALPEQEKARLSQRTIPSYEFSTGLTAPEYYMAPDTTPALQTVYVFVHNSQGLGEVRLKSADPTVPLAFDPAFLEHPYDKRVAIEGTREVMKVAASAEFQRETLGEWDVPKSKSEGDILAFWREKCGSTWHMSGTCKIGRDEKADGAVVDTEFRVHGLEGLRVVDMSIMPIIACCHTQSTAYQIGMIAAEKLLTEYGLDA